MRRLAGFVAAIVLVMLVSADTTAAGEQRKARATIRPQIETGMMGGVKHPSDEELAVMQRAPYVLRARDGELMKVPAEKTMLPHDPKGHPQGANVTMTSDGTLYVRGLSGGFCKSTDGGRTWAFHTIKEVEGWWQVLDDGTFVHVHVTSGDGVTEPAQVWQSRDQGKSWRKLSEFKVEVPGGYEERHGHWGLRRLSDNTLYYGMDIREGVTDWSAVSTGWIRLIMFRSTDGGKTWQGPIEVCDWGSEGGFAELPSGRLLAAVRYQRPLLVSDPPEILKRPGGRDLPYPYKHLSLVDSDDGGRTWRNHRLLTSVFGQCYGYPAALADGTVVVIHDTRYGPGPDSARALISYDEGKTWEDEAYYVLYGKAVTGYTQSVVLADQTILTVGGLSEAAPGRGPSDWIGHTDFWAIRWRPVKNKERRQNGTPREKHSAAKP